MRGSSSIAGRRCPSAATGDGDAAAAAELVGRAGRPLAAKLVREVVDQMVKEKEARLNEMD